MHYDGKFKIKASREKVFNFLLDPNAMAKCLPDLQTVDVKSADRFLATVKVGVGFVRGNFKFDFNVVEKDPPKMAKLVAHGSGTGSTIDLETIFELSDVSGGGTELSWQADAQVGGMIASVGQRLIGGLAEKTVTSLFDTIKVELEKS